MRALRVTYVASSAGSYARSTGDPWLAVWDPAAARIVAPLRAIVSMRVDKGYASGGGHTPDDTLRCRRTSLKLDKPVCFIAATRPGGARGRPRKCSAARLEDAAPLRFGNEPCGGLQSRLVTTAATAHGGARSRTPTAAGRSRAGTAVELDILAAGRGESRPTAVDPGGERVRATREPAADPLPYDEAYDEDGQPRPHYAAVLQALGDPASVAAEVKRRLTARGVSFGAADDGVFALDPVPRILTEPEWSELQAGIVQRLRALEALVADVYGDGRVFEAGVLTREDVEASHHYEPAMRGATPPRWVSFAGLDVVRSPDGRFRRDRGPCADAGRIAYSVAAATRYATCSAWTHAAGPIARVRGELALALHDAALARPHEPRVVIRPRVLPPRAGGARAARARAVRPPS